MDVLVVGASLAGLRTALALRRLGFDGTVTLVGDEPHLPYDRPPLSKDFLAGRATEDDVRLLAPSALADRGIDLRLGVPATRLDVDARAVVVGGDELRYGTLVIATGSRARSLPGQPDAPGIHVLRTLDDALALREAFSGSARLVVVGGGVIGLEVASTARGLGLEVTVVEGLPRLLPRLLPETVSRAVLDLHVGNGVEVLLGAGVAGIEADGRVRGVRLTDGSAIPADVVVVGIGARPAVDWLDGSSVPVDNGIPCDGSGRVTGLDAVYAVGDVARWHNGFLGYAARCEHWTGAVEQAELVAGALCGSPGEYASAPYVWSDQHGTRIQVVGAAADADEVARLEADDAAKGPVFLGRHADHIGSLVTFRNPRGFARLSRLVRERTRWDDAVAAAAGA